MTAQRNTKDIAALLVDEDAIARAAIARLLEEGPCQAGVVQAASVEEAARRAERTPPDVVLLAWRARRGGNGGRRGAWSELFEHYPVILLLDSDYSNGIGEWPGIRARGFLSKRADAAELARAVTTVAGGETFVGADIAQKVALSLLPHGGKARFERLSQREREVMCRLTAGESVQDISSALALSPKTVNTYRYRLYEKLGVDNDIELTLLALHYDVIELR